MESKCPWPTHPHPSKDAKRAGSVLWWWLVGPGAYQAALTTTAVSPLAGALMPRL